MASSIDGGTNQTKLWLYVTNDYRDHNTRVDANSDLQMLSTLQENLLAEVYDLYRKVCHSDGVVFVQERLLNSLVS